MDAEYTLMAYFVKKNPAAIKKVNKSWWSDVCLRGIHEVVSQTAARMKAQVLYEELRQRRIIRNGDGELYKPVLRDLYGRVVSGINETDAGVMLTQIARLARSRKILEHSAQVLLDSDHFDLDSTQSVMKELSIPVCLDDDHGGQYLDNYARRLEIIEERKKRAAVSAEGEVGILTGIHMFDYWTGGLLPGEFGVLAGKSNVGKTAAVTSFALTAWAAGHDTMIVSGEMSREDLEFRIDSALARVSGMKFRKAELDDDDYARWDRMIKDERVMRSDNILWVASFTRKFDCDAIRAEMQKAFEITGRHISMISVDYLNIMSPIHAVRGESSMGWESQGDVVWDIKELTEENNLVLWTPNQVVDAAYGKSMYDLTDLKYARSIGITAPVVVAVIQDGDDAERACMKLQILKMRNSAFTKKAIRLTPNMEFMMIDDPELRQGESFSEEESDMLEVAPHTNHRDRRGGGRFSDE
jgi:hypothetical protein